ncbi:hypothetical protein NYE37_03830 [Thermoactinomyces sp. FSL K6-2592]|jgi:hypothetical protein|uniref:hypothetical protein n=1 Tax=Thermoactinomyces sp. FSL K6-2592 TaxID=2975347 RepID=UPI0030FC491C
MNERFILYYGEDYGRVYDTETKENVYLLNGLTEENKKHLQDITKLLNAALITPPQKSEQAKQEKTEGMGDYEALGRRIGQLVDRKQAEYGDSWGKSADILRVLYPEGVKPSEYHYMLGIVRILDKLSRIANGNQGEENAWADIAGYGLLGYFDTYK